MNETLDKHQLYDYLLQTQVQTDTLDYPLKSELDTLIDLFDTEEFVPYLRHVAQKETMMIEKGMLEDEDGDGVGFFGALLQLVEGSIDGLGRINWSALKQKARNITQKINRVNPATVAARNSLRALISMNIFGYATAINKSEQVKRKVVDMYRRLGGKDSYILQAIATGAKKRPLLAKKGTVHGLGSTDISILLRRAGSFLNQIKTWTNQVRTTQQNSELESVRRLLEMNIYGYSTLLAKYPSVKSKVVNLYVGKGGKRQDIERAIAVGSRKRPYTPSMHKNFNVNRPSAKQIRPIPSRALHGNNDVLGEPVTVASMLAAAGGLLAQIKKWLQDAGLSVKDAIDITKAVTSKSDTKSNTKSTTNTKSQTTTNTPTKQIPTPKYPKAKPKIAAPTAAPSSAPSQPSATVNVGGSKKGVKIAIGLGVAGLTGVALYKWQHNKKHTLKGITLN